MWKITSNEYACTVSIVTHYPRPIGHYRGLLSKVNDLAHITIEVHQCLDEPCIPVEDPVFATVTPVENNLAKDG